MENAETFKTFDDMWEWIGRAHEEDWVFPKRHTSMKKIRPEQVLLRLMEEAGELSQAYTRDGSEIEETIDVLAVLMHWAIIKGYSREYLMAEAAKKMNKALKPPPPPRALYPDESPAAPPEPEAQSPEPPPAVPQ